MKSQTARTDSGIRETLGFDGFSPVVVPEVLGRDEEDSGLDILALMSSGSSVVRREREETELEGIGFYRLPPLPPVVPVVGKSIDLEPPSCRHSQQFSLS